MSTLPDLPPGYAMEDYDDLGGGWASHEFAVTMYCWADYGRRLHRAGVVEALKGCIALLEMKYPNACAEAARTDTDDFAGDVARAYVAARRALRIAEGGGET